MFLHTRNQRTISGIRTDINSRLVCFLAVHIATPTTMHCLIILSAIAAALAEEDHEFFFDKESDFTSPSEHIRVTRDGSGGSNFGDDFYSSYFSPSYESEASSVIPLSSEYERIRSGRAAGLNTFDDYGLGENLLARSGFGSSREGRATGGLGFGNNVGGSSYTSSSNGGSSSGFFGSSGSGNGGRSFRSDGSSGNRGARALYYPGLIGLGYGSGGIGLGGAGIGLGGAGLIGYGGGGSGGGSAGLGFIGSGGYGLGGAGAGLIGLGGAGAGGIGLGGGAGIGFI